MPDLSDPVLCTVLREAFTLDNLWHSLVAIAFTGVLTFFLPGFWIVWSALAALGLYLREASQVSWDFTLRFSLHKHLEWIVGSLAGLVAAVLIAVIV